MATFWPFWPKSLLTRGFAEQRSTDCQHDGHGAKEQEAPAEAGGARDGTDQGRPDEEAEVAQRGDGRDGGAAAPLAADPAGEAEQRRRRERETGAGDDEAGERDGRLLRGRRDDQADRGGHPGEEHARCDRRALHFLREKAPGGHRCREEARTEAADRGARAERSLEEQRAPALEPALDEKRDGENGADDEQRPRDARAAAAAFGSRTRGEIEEHAQEHEARDAAEDPGWMHA